VKFSNIGVHIFKAEISPLSRPSKPVGCLVQE